MGHVPGMSEKENSFLCGDGRFENIVFYQGLLSRSVNRTYFLVERVRAIRSLMSMHVGVYETLPNPWPTDCFMANTTALAFDDPVVGS